MNIQINNEYRISTDSLNWMIDKAIVRKNRDTGEKEDAWEHIKYFSTLENAVNYFPEHVLRESNANGVVEALDTVKKVCAELTAALSPAYEVHLK